MEDQTPPPGSLSLKTRASRGVAFLGARTVMIRAIGFVRVAVLARLLTPTDFGVYGLAIVLYLGLRTLSAFGVQRYLIQKESLDLTLVRSAWSYNIFRGAAVGGLIIVVAPIYASVLDAPDVGAILPVIALAAVLGGFVNPAFTLAERQVRFGPIVVVNIIAACLETALVITLAYYLRDAYALAWGLVVSVVNLVVLSFVLFDFVGWPRLSISDFKELFNVGKHLTFSSMATFVSKQFDNLIAGALLGTEALGVYVVSYRLAYLPLEVMSTIVNRVAIPTLSRLQSEQERLARAYRGLVDVQLCAMAPVVTLLVVFAHPIVALIYGERWAAAAPILQALVLVMVGSGLYQVAEPYALARGNFKTIAKSKLVEIMVFLPCAYFGARFWGLAGLAVGAGIGYLSSALVLAYWVRRLGGPKVQWVRQLVSTMLSTVPSVLVAWVVRASFEGPQPIETVLMLIAFGTTYLVVLVLFRRALATRILGFARSAFARQADTAGSLGTAEGKS